MRRMKTTIVALVPAASAMLLLAACGGRVTIARANTSTGTTSGSSGPGEVSGTMINRYFTESAPPQDAPVDLSATTIAAYVSQGGARTTFPGVGKADGTFQVPGVPAGPFLLRVGTAYALSEARTLDFGTEVSGRPDAAQAQTGDEIVGTLQNLAPWQENDQLAWVNINGNGACYSAGGVVGSTSIAGEACAWSGAVIDASKGDVLHAYQWSSGATGYMTIVRHVAFTGVEQQGGVTNVTGTLDDVAPTQSLTADYRRSAFAAQVGAIQPNAKLNKEVLLLETGPGAREALGLYNWTNFGSDAQQLLDFGGHPADLSDVKVSSSYGNPFPPSWGLVVVAGANTYVAPGGQGLFGSVTVAMSAEEAAKGPIQPIVSPVQNFRIADQDAFGALPGTTLEPSITWDPPALGTPTAYHVAVYVDAKPIARVVTSQTSITMPPGVLMAGMQYAVIVTAVVSPIDTTTQPFRFGTRLATADAISNVATP
jgi:hypothetical protein